MKTMNKMSKIVRKKRNYLSNDYNLRSKTKRIKTTANDKTLAIDDGVDDNGVINSQECEQMAKEVTVRTSSVIQMTPKLTKMPNKYYNLRRRPLTTDGVASGAGQTQASRVTIEDLPDDCLLDIFERLTTLRDKCYVRSVNKRFNHLANRLLRVQKEFTVRSTYGSLKDDQMLTKAMFESVVTKCPNLQVFKMPGFYAKDYRDSNDRISNREMCVLANKCPDLRELDICGCGQVGEKGINQVVNKCHKLEKLSLSFCQSVTGVCLKKLTKNFRTLSLNLNDMSPSLMDALKYLSEGDGRYLSEINVNTYNQIESAETVLKAICNNFKSLRCLRYSISSKDKPMFGIFGNLTNLTHLAFDFKPFNLSDQQFLAILTGCSQLKSLYMRCDKSEDHTDPITDYSVRKLPFLCPHLERVYLTAKGASIQSVTDSSVINFGQLSHLRELSFNLYDNIGDSVITVIKMCPKLMSLTVLNSNLVTNAIIDALIIAAKSQPTKKIKFEIHGQNMKNNRKKLPFNLTDVSLR